MKDYIIYTDSTADLSPKLVESLGVMVIPFEFTIDGKSYYDYPDGRELDVKSFYDLLRAGHTATTSLVNVDRYKSIFEPELAAGKQILYIAFSSGLTGSVGCALTAAEELNAKYPGGKLVVVDSLNASMGQGLLVYNAVQKKKEGMGLDELAAWVTDNRLLHAAWFTVDDLGHLRRGGRVSAAAAVLGGMLGIKPVLHVDDTGHLIPVSKVRGRRASLEDLVERIEKTGTDLKTQTIFISHGDSLEDCRWVEQQIKKRLGTKNIFINFIGPVIGAHSGPGTIALFFTATGR